MIIMLCYKTCEFCSYLATSRNFTSKWFIIISHVYCHVFYSIETGNYYQLQAFEQELMCTSTRYMRESYKPQKRNSLKTLNKLKKKKT